MKSHTKFSRFAVYWIQTNKQKRKLHINIDIPESFAKNFCKLFANNTSKEMCTFLVFLNYTSGYLKFCKNFAFLKCHGQGLIKNVYFIDIYFFATFLLYDRILQKIINFCKFAIFLLILKVEHKSFPLIYHLPYLDIKH